MVVLTLQYYEIIERDFTGVDIYIEQNRRRIAHYRNYDATERFRERCGNQSECFSLPNLQTARSFIESSGAYKEVSPRPRKAPGKISPATGCQR